MKFLVACILVLVLATPGQSQQRAIEGVISSQIEAFRRDDFATAFTFAAPAIRRIFETPDRFGSMVRQGYPMVHRPADVTFLDLDATGGSARQRVLIRDAAGVFHTLEYEMVEGPDGWKIAGVRLLTAAEVGV
jgi:hypothetical protein